MKGLIQIVYTNFTMNNCKIMFANVTLASISSNLLINNLVINDESPSNTFILQNSEFSNSLGKITCIIVYHCF